MRYSMVVSVTLSLALNTVWAVACIGTNYFGLAQPLGFVLEISGAVVIGVLCGLFVPRVMR